MSKFFDWKLISYNSTLLQSCSPQARVKHWKAKTRTAKANQFKTKLNINLYTSYNK